MAAIVDRRGAENWVWDTSTLDWVKGLQPVISTDTLSVSLAGVATAANQTSGNATLSSLLTELQGKADLTETQPTSLASLPALAAGSAKVGGVYQVSGQLIDETGTLRTVQRSFATATLSGNTEVVSAQGAGVKIRVISYQIVALLALSVKFQSATTDISPLFALAANGGIAVSDQQHGLLQTAANEALNINLSLGTTVGVAVTWIPVA